MNTATVTRPARSVVAYADSVSFVPRYPIGLPEHAVTRRWMAEIIVPDSDICPQGTLIDSALPIIVGDLEALGEHPAPGERELAYSLALSYANPLGFKVGDVYPEGGYNQEF